LEIGAVRGLRAWAALDGQTGAAVPTWTTLRRGIETTSLGKRSNRWRVFTFSWQMARARAPILTRWRPVRIRGPFSLQLYWEGHGVKPCPFFGPKSF